MNDDSLHFLALIFQKPQSTLDYWAMEAINDNHLSAQSSLGKVFILPTWGTGDDPSVPTVDDGYNHVNISPFLSCPKPYIQLNFILTEHRWFCYRRHECHIRAFSFAVIFLVIDSPIDRPLPLRTRAYTISLRKMAEHITDLRRAVSSLDLLEIVQIH